MLFNADVDFLKIYHVIGPCGYTALTFSETIVDYSLNSEHCLE
jgi:hypothetical protein